jgi:hypothetical protein
MQLLGKLLKATSSCCSLISQKRDCNDENLGNETHSHENERYSHKNDFFSKLCTNASFLSKTIQQLKKMLQLQGLHFKGIISITSPKRQNLQKFGDYDLIFKATID